jgi:hypothetical protein
MAYSSLALFTALSFSLATALHLDPQQLSERPQPGSYQHIKVTQRNHVEVPEYRGGEQDAGLCEKVSALLKSQKHAAIAERMWDIACKRQRNCPHTLPSLSNGCLMVATDASLRAMLGTIGRPHPCAFTEMVLNSFLHQAECPHLRDPAARIPARSNSKGGLVFEPCEDHPRERGFRSTSGVCVPARFLGETAEATNISVYTVDAMMGLPPAWEYVVNRHSPDVAKKPSKEEQRRLADATSFATWTAPQMKIEFYQCIDNGAGLPPVSPWGFRNDSNQTLLQMCKDQVDVMNAAHAGNSTCTSEFVAYDTTYAGTGITFKPFEESDLQMIQDARCSQADSYYEDLWRDYMPEENGTIKVMLGSSASLLGVSSFPGDPIRGNFIGQETMPGGSLPEYNLGMTLVHEAGHYFGLFHTFQDGCTEDNDLVSDTGPEMQAYFGCPAKGDEEAISSGCKKGQIAPIHNFMDYSDDRCMCMFTANQITRIQDHVTTYMISP